MYKILSMKYRCVPNLSVKIFLLFLIYFNISISVSQELNVHRERSFAYEFSQKMGRGANFMAAKIEGRFHSNYDFELLAKNHFTHCRIGGKLNLHIGGAPGFIIDKQRIADLKRAADLCLANGLIAVIDPLHLYNEHYEDDQIDVLKKIWEQVAIEFADYPVTELAFEIMNEPHNGYNLKNIIDESLAVIRNVPGNEQRIVIVSGQGFTTRKALINAFDNNVFPSADHYVIGTFHYYDPKSFTKQGTFNVTTYWGETGDIDSDWSSVETAFDEVVEANTRWAGLNRTEPLPVYLGEYGVDNQAPEADRKRWLCWIRMQAEKRGFSTALWNMYSLTSKGIGPWTREQKEDPSTRYLQEDVVDVLMTRYEAEEGEYTSDLTLNTSFQGYSGEGAVDYRSCQDNNNLMFRGVYIPRNDKYIITIRYRNDGQDDLSVNMGLFDIHGNSVGECRVLVFPPSSDQESWSKLVVEMELSGDGNAIIGFVGQQNNMPLSIDYLSISKGEYYDNLFPSKKEKQNISTGYMTPDDTTNIRVYPSVFRDYTVIYFSESNCSDLIYSLCDINGRLIKQGKLYSSTGQITLGEKLNSGCYILQLAGKNFNRSFKLIKQVDC